ncbi:alanine/glycine:cation symporter family protein [Eilatimonas milleporae]|uniref:AGCS family alanine or glycine:cation symporter n=1 Tax=Eilatimonas milleporae TaxID=911205 RepID=A0A3M0CJN6_9PROT|nr:alanine/glycine:cation symporter family protein [Eilatimonas milleporae]RMB08987.1 AGCS family alanine or glycine:cation symporter [Eilatimonas milleporae]
MNRILAGLAALIAGTTAAVAAEDGATAGSRSFSDLVNDTISPVTDFISGIIFFEIPLDFIIDGAPGFPFIVIWLLGGAVFFTFYMGFVNLRGFRQSLRIVSGKYDDPDDPGEVTHFQALTAALSGTVGLGNIAGVAIALTIGGPGATFWMILAGLFGMTSKFTECTLGLKYREIDADGVVSGGPMHYLSKGLARLGRPGLGKVLAVMAALICIGGAFGAGNMFQVNQSSTQFTNVMAELTGGTDSLFYGRPWIFGILFSIAVGMVIIGGIRQITHVTEFLVPVMAGIYVTAALVILGTHITEIPGAFGQIFAGAFTGEGITGGIIGVMIQGLRRATFSNEAGIGSASIAHAAAKTREPVAEGLVALLEPFVDTVIICTMTALVIIVTGSLETEMAQEAARIGGTAIGISLTSQAFDSVIVGFKYVLSVAVVLFAFSTSITWFYYGQRSFLYLVGNKPNAELAFKSSYLVVLVIGSAMQLTAVMDFADAMLLGMGFPNIVGLYLLRHEVRDLMQSYFARLRSGEIRPTEETVKVTG